MQIYRDVKYNGGYDGPNTTVYSTLVLFEQSTCIGWIHVCYIWLLTKKQMYWFLVHIERTCETVTVKNRQIGSWVWNF